MFQFQKIELSANQFLINLILFQDDPPLNDKTYLNLSELPKDELSFYLFIRHI